MYWNATSDSSVNSAAAIVASVARRFARAFGTPKIVFPSIVTPSPIAYPEKYQSVIWSSKTMVPAPVIDVNPKADVGIIAFGSSHFAVEESRDQLREEAGIETSYLRVRAYPSTAHVHEFIRRHKRVYIVEQIRDAQLMKLLLMDGEAEFAARLRSVLHYNGLPIDARSISDDTRRSEGSDPARRQAGQTP